MYGYNFIGYLSRKFNFNHGNKSYLSLSKKKLFK